MRYFLICDNNDTLVGMRLAGVDGVLVHGRKETQEAVRKAAGDPAVGILLICEKLAKLCPELIYDLKLNMTSTLVVEIPDRHGTGRTPDSITRYIREAIGVKL